MTISARIGTGKKLWAKKKIIKKTASLRNYTGPIIPKVPPPSWYPSLGWVTVYPKEKWIICGSDSVEVDEIIEFPKKRWIFDDSDSEEETEEEDENWPVTEEEKGNRPVNI